MDVKSQSRSPIPLRSEEGSSVGAIHVSLHLMIKEVIVVSVSTYR